VTRVGVPKSSKAAQGDASRRTSAGHGEETVPPDAKEVEIEDRVRWSDVDAAGIICYGAYLRFYEIAETELFRAAGEPYHEIFDRYDIWLPRVHIESDFSAPAFLDDLLRVSAAVAKIGTTSLHVRFRVQRAGEDIARARFVMACVSRKGLSKRSLPAELVHRLEPFVSPG
jgi:acyl-CoA thioester hydrolase